MNKILHFLCWLFAIICGVILITGGGVLTFGHSKIEASQLDVWAALLAVFITLEHYFFPSTRTFFKSLERLTQKLVSLEKPFKWAVLLLVFCFGILVLAHSFKHLSFATHGFDQVFMHQPFFHPWAARPLQCALCDNGTYFGEHISFSMFALTPITWIMGLSSYRDHLIYFLQGTLFVIALLALIKWGPLSKDPHTWIWIAFILICNRALRNAALWDFREDNLSFIYLTGFLIALNYQKWFLLGFLGLLALTSKEHVGLILPWVIFPLYFDRSITISQKNKKQLLIALVSCSIFYVFLVFKFFIPYFNPATQGGTSEITKRLYEFGSTPKEILFTILTSPQAWVLLLKKYIFSATSAKYVVLLFAPYFYLSQSAWVWWIPAVPAVAMNIISISPAQKSLNFHYDLVALPFLIWALLKGVQIKKPNSRHIVIALLIGLATSGRWPMRQITNYWPSASDISDSRYLANIPGDGILATTLVPMAQLTQFEELRQLLIPDRAMPQETAEAWGMLWNFNLSDLTLIAGHNAHQAQALLLDMKEPWLQKVYPAALQMGWTEVSSSPSSRYRFLKSPHRVF